MELDEDHVATMMDALTNRLGEMRSETDVGKRRKRFEFILPSRGLLGFHPAFMAMTKGTGAVKGCGGVGMGP